MIFRNNFGMRWNTGCSRCSAPVEYPCETGAARFIPWSPPLPPPLLPAFSADSVDGGTLGGELMYEVAMASLKKCTLRIFAHFSFPFTRKVFYLLQSLFAVNFLLFI